MAFKLKKRIHEILQMDAEAYAKFFKKESQRAATFGELDVVVCSEHAFADGKVGALVLMGTFVGDLANFYKQNKTTPTFAKGTCRFEANDFHLNLSQGRLKGDKFVKAGRRLWAKTALTPTAHKGNLPAPSKGEDRMANPQVDQDKPNTSKGESKGELNSPNPPNTDHPTKVDWKALQQQYLQAKKSVQQVILWVQTHPESAPSPQQMGLVKRALKAAQQWLQAYRQAAPPLQKRLASTQEQLTQEYQQLQRLLSKLEQHSA